METSEKLITENLDVWTSVVKAKSSAGRGVSKNRELYGIQKLRALVLELAVMGKLVEQDPEDETVRATLKSDLFGSDSEADAPFEIPPVWRWSKLDQLASINGGFAFKSSDYSDEGTRVVRISDFDEHGFKDAKIVRHSFSPELEKFSLRDGDILMAMTGGTVGKSFHTRALTEPMLVNQRVATIRASEAIASNYLNILIQSELTQKVIHEAKNSTNDNISMRDIKSFLVPLPPLAEQHRIVAKVDELMALCDALKASLATAQATQLNLADSLVEQAVT
ncbi:restriction endonuclease subunit S [bacterium]|nr:restriction endonuclease subunit S [bacterium]